MAENIPDGISRSHIIDALRQIDSGAMHNFAESSSYDVLFQGRRYAPKAVIGLAAKNLTGVSLKPADFKGGQNTKCFRILRNQGFSIVSKGDTDPFPEEVPQPSQYPEGSAKSVYVNRYERDPKARAEAIKIHGSICSVCQFNFEEFYGELGAGFIHVHHVVPLSEIGGAYHVDPNRDLVPVCPNCHAMLHKRNPPYSVRELEEIVQTANNSLQTRCPDLKL